MQPDNRPKYTLNSVYLYLTGGCNLRCTHCWLTPDYVADDQEAPDGITTDDVKKVIEQGKPLGLYEMKLTGGEPFINKEIFEIIELISSENITINIETNGTLIDRDTTSFLKKKGINHISVSIDSPNASFHDTFRGKSGALHDAVSGVRHMTEEGLDVQIIMSLTTDNVKDIEDLVKMARELNAGSVKINPILPIGRGNVLTEKGKTVPVEELIELCRWMEGDLSKKYGIETIFSLPTAFKSLRRFFGSNNSECHILNILGIIATGHISICGIGKEEPTLIMGNIREDDLGDIWKNSPILKSLREIVPKKMDGICGRCILKGVCLGACRANAFVLEGNLSAPDWICRDAYEKGLFPESRII